ncbi:MAG: glycosyl hydrolase-related protein [Planctomycetota bacterium]
MRWVVSRREFLKAGVAGAVAVMLAWTAVARDLSAQDDRGDVCLTICNHWSYIGIGWQLGIESCVLSVTDAMEMANRPPHVKTCINLDARAYEFMAEKFPEVTERLKTYLAAGKVELIGGSYGQPMGTSISGESNIRQIVVGRELIQRVLGYPMVTFLEEEEFTHPQIPQIAALAGFRYASLAQLDTWGRAGCPRLDLNTLLWQGIDGTTIPCVPKNALFGYAPEPERLAASLEFKQLATLGKPLIFAWEEFGWESPEQPAYLTSPARYQKLQSVEFVTLREYLDKYGAQGRKTIYLPMDAWNKSLTWGLGGDQIRILDRKVDSLLLAAELFDVIATALGERSHVEALEAAWRDLLASQSHDVGLCEYSRWQGDRMAPFDRIEDYHSFTWGTIGYNHLSAAQKQGQAVLDAVTKSLADRVDSASTAHGQRALTVFNPQGWPRSDVVTTGRLYPLPPGCREIVVRDRGGAVVPSQMVKASRDPEGNLVVAEVAFQARDVPSAGYDTNYLDFAPRAATLDTALRVNETKLVIENEHIRVGLDPTTGALASLIHKSSAWETPDSSASAFPRLTGRPNPNLSTRPNPPAFYDSAKSQARIDWLAKGPLWATVRAQHDWPYLKFETRVTLMAGAPYVEVVSRILAQLPPHSDASPPDIREGYWFSLQPAFKVAQVLRDFPFGVEETGNPTFHALTFVDLVGEDRGLLVLHPGTQFFRREESGAFSNLVMREWESHFTREYGWPIYAEYRHALLSYRGTLENSDRLRAAAAFTQPLVCTVAEPHKGTLPPVQSFLDVAPTGVQLSALRKKSGPGFELRVVELEGRRTEAAVNLNFSVRNAAETDLLGKRRAGATSTYGRLPIVVEPWQIRTFHLE